LKGQVRRASSTQESHNCRRPITALSESVTRRQVQEPHFVPDDFHKLDLNPSISVFFAFDPRQSMIVFPAGGVESRLHKKQRPSNQTSANHFAILVRGSNFAERDWCLRKQQCPKLSTDDSNARTVPLGPLFNQQDSNSSRDSDEMGDVIAREEGIWSEG
jgi:hypothetical protein